MLLGDKTVCGKSFADIGKGTAYLIQYQCDKCKNLFKGTVQNYWKGQKRRGYTGLTYCQPCGTSMTNSNGGLAFDEDGYLKIRMPDGTYEKEHRLLVGSSLGRKLSPHEHVHHIDNDKTNNKLDNLVLVQNNSIHKKAHFSLETLGFELVKAGYINYDRENHIYVAHNKLRELLETPLEDNQQPSLESNFLEGSETSDESLGDNKFTTSAGHLQPLSDDIVRTARINRRCRIVK